MCIFPIDHNFVGYLFGSIFILNISLDSSEVLAHSKFAYFKLNKYNSVLVLKFILNKYKFVRKIR